MLAAQTRVVALKVVKVIGFRVYCKVEANKISLTDLKYERGVHGDFIGFNCKVRIPIV